MRNSRRRVNKVAGMGVELHSVHLEQKLAGKDVEELLELMEMQRRPVVRRTRVFKHGDGACALSGGQLQERLFSDKSYG
jgi:hypothetical protein